MSKRIEGVTEKLLECAKEEFLTKGYEDASLRMIASTAGSSKGAIYIRYPDKAALFSALVDDVADGLIALFIRANEDFLDIPDAQKETRAQESSDKGVDAVTDYLYDNFDEFKLICTCSDSKKYNEIMHQLVEISVTSTFNFIESSGSDAITAGRVDRELAHLLSQAFLTGLFEVVVHDMPKSKATQHIARLRKFFELGWLDIFSLETRR